MLFLALMFVFVFLIVPFFGPSNLAGPFFYRKPLFLSLFGGGVSLLGVCFISFAHDFKSVPELASSFPNLGLAAKLVAVTAVAAGGSLIASGIQFSIQKSALADKRSIDAGLREDVDLLLHLQEEMNQLFVKRGSMSDDEFTHKLGKLYDIRDRLNKRVDSAGKKLRDYGG